MSLLKNGPDVFGEKLKRAATEIKAEAAGRVCGGCKYLLGTHCIFWCGDVKVYKSTAVACRHWDSAILKRRCIDVTHGDEGILCY